MTKKLYEVKVETRNYEWYEVSARDEAEARENWHLGTLTGTEEAEVLDVLSVTEAFDSEEEYAEEEDDFASGYYASDDDPYTTR